MKLIKDNLGKVAITVDKDYWNSTKDYNRLVVVQRSSNSYTTYISRKPVPAGTPLTDRNYWIPFSHFQEDYADWTNELQRTLNEYKSSVANAIMFEANKDFIENGVVTTITFSITVAQIPQTNTIIKFYKNNVLVSTATVLPQQFDNTGKYQWTDNTSVESLYKVEVVVNGNTYVGLWKINIAYDFYIGTGVDHVNIISNPNYKHTGLNSLAGNYYLTPSAGDYIYIICINNIVPSNVKLSGFELPIAFYTTTTIDNKEYVVYRSLNTYQAGSFTVTINDVSYDNNSYIAHLIEEVQKFNTKAEETEEKVETIADEETITMTENSKVAVRNRRYVATTSEVQGNKGYIILEKGQTFKEQIESVTEGNTIFEVRYDYDLNGEIVTIPNNCTLKFEGGNIANGTIVGVNTLIIGNLYHIFGIDISFLGNWIVPNIDTDMFIDLSGDNDLKKVFALSSDDITNVINIRKYAYDYSVSVTANNVRALVPHANDTIVIDGTINLVPNALAAYSVIYVDKANITIMGSGTIKGDALQHTYTNYGTQANPSTHEWGHIISTLSNLEEAMPLNLEIKGITLCYACGDGIASVSASNVNIHDIEIHHCRRQGISVIGGDYVNIENCNIHDIYLTSPLVTGLGVGALPGAAVDIEPNTNYCSCNFISIKNCYVENCKGGLYVASSWHGIKNVTISDCMVKNTETRPFYNYGGINVSCKECIFVEDEYVDTRAASDIIIRETFDTLFENNTVTNYTIDVYGGNMNTKVISNKITGGRIRVQGSSTYDTTTTNKVVIKGNDIYCPYTKSSQSIGLRAAVGVFGMDADIIDNVIYGNVYLQGSIDYVKQNLTDVVKGNTIQGSFRTQIMSAVVTNNTITDFNVAGLLNDQFIQIVDSTFVTNTVFTNNIITFKYNTDSKITVFYIDSLPTLLDNTIYVKSNLSYVYQLTVNAKGFVNNDKIIVSDDITLSAVGSSLYRDNISSNSFIDNNEVIL